MAATSGIFRVMLRMSIHPGKEREFEETWYKVGHAITEHPANLRQWLSRCDDEDGAYYVVSDWVSEPGFREFERSPEHLDHRTRLHPFRASASMVTMHVVYEMTGRALAGGTPAPSASR
ncbi:MULTISPECIES: antibiotic biosynthesis monooxygenase family protein [Thermomonosporaceae]|uniref:antibiotic biosynthesis monooxygenase family protein n=1 Tax=Thermomonosporaceae TaxID=2012 RepID=UPI00255AC6DF|nr:MULTISPECIES: antibiotic biosynthesis monooxygenase family protein [Thermomonosporaceae]MDL4774130.1 antibiotic biosynthesis monooxygenase family protein [Actinomadura xylanilytica]